MTSSIAAIHVAKNQLGLDDDTYRAKLMLITGKASTKLMTEDERQRVLTNMRSEGFKPSSKRPNGRRKLTGKYAKKLQALWIAGWNLGVVRSRDDAALETFIIRQTGIASERFLHVSDDAAKVIEALRGWISRETGLEWNRAPLDWLGSDGAKIAWTQWKILHPGVDLVARRNFDQVALRIAGRTDMLLSMNQADWIKVMNDLGSRIRTERKQVAA